MPTKACYSLIRCIQLESRLGFPWQAGRPRPALLTTWVTLVLAAGIARVQEPTAFLRLGVGSSSNSVQIFLWTFCVLVPWLSFPTSDSASQSLLLRLVRLRPFRMMGVSILLSMSYVFLYGVAFLLTMQCLDGLLGRPWSPWEQALILVRASMLTLPIATLVPLLASSMGLAGRLVVGLVVTLFLVALLGQGAGATLTGTPAKDIMVSLHVRAIGSAWMLTFSAAALAHGLLVGRRH